MIALAISERTLARLKKFELPARACGIILGYAAWISVFRLLVLTFVTYFVLSSSSRPPRFEEVYEAFGSNELGIMGMSALIFALVFPRLNPVSAPPPQEVFARSRFERFFLPGFAQGTVLAAALVFSYLLAGVYRYIGFFMQFEDTPVAVANVVLRTASLASLVYFEEYLFRKKILNLLLRWRPPTGAYDSMIVAAGLSIVYCIVKTLQFELGLMHWITLFLLSFLLTFRAIDRKGFDEGAGFLVALLLIFHPLLSLPVFGNDLSGVLMVKYQVGGSDTANSTVRLFTGGSGGPLSSLALQLLLILTIARETLSRRKTVGLRSRP